VQEHVAHLTSDLLASEMFSVPLGAVIPAHQWLVRKALPPTLEEVAFNLQLPVLDGVPAQSLIALRRNEGDAFRRFQGALRTAIQERIKVAGASCSAVMAEEIRRDVIDPRVSEIGSLLKSSEWTLTKKSATGVFLGALATTCGILCGAPVTMAFSAGATAAVTLLGKAAGSHIDRLAEIKAGDMYFMWKATEHAGHNR